MTYFIIIITLLIYACHPLHANSDAIEILVKPRTTISLGITQRSTPLIEPALSDIYASYNPKPIYFHKKMLGTASVSGADLLMLTVPSTGNISYILNTLHEHPDVEFAEINHKIELFEEPNDPLYHHQNYLSNSHLNDLHKIQSVEPVIVAVIDTGIDLDHPDLADQLYTNPNEEINGIDDDNNGYIDDVHGYNFYRYFTSGGHADVTDYHGHGTHISGIIAAKKNNHIGVSGISDATQILPINFLSRAGSGRQLDAAMAIYYAVDQGARIINCSWGFESATQTLRQAIEYAESLGIIIVAAAGNDGESSPEYPAAFPETLAISAIGSDHTPSHFTSYGEHIDFSAYGESIFNTTKNHYYSSKSGTSQSAAIVSGIIAKIMAAKPTITKADVIDLLIKSTSDLTRNGKDEKTGYGMINGTYIANILAPSEPDEETRVITSKEKLSNAFNFPNPIQGNRSTFSFDSTITGEAIIRIYTTTGQIEDEIYLPIFGERTHTISWNVPTHLRNGTYLYTITAQGDSGTMTVKGKLVVYR